MCMSMVVITEWIYNISLINKYRYENWFLKASTWHWVEICGELISALRNGQFCPVFLHQDDVGNIDSNLYDSAPCLSSYVLVLCCKQQFLTAFYLKVLIKLVFENGPSLSVVIKHSIYCLIILIFIFMFLYY